MSNCTGPHPGMADKNHPVPEIAEAVTPLIARGAVIFQKWTCSTCGSRQTMDQANLIFLTGRCEECSQITDIEVSGCNFTVIQPLAKDHQAADLDEMLRSVGLKPPRRN